ncbi:MAG TPA: acylphosphatase [Gammaproteobacteria bacterium]|nr:acylphosphatase [Gammaproteobacteria bacterium]
MNEVRRRFLVEGRVQGVSFRAATRARASGLGLRGWVRNLPDGRVEVVAGGSQASVGELEVWLHDGPPAARVRAVWLERFQGEPGDDFLIL